LEQGLKLSAGDLLDISVFDTPELSQKVRVDDAGDVTLLMGGNVRVAGLNAADAGRAIATQLRRAQILKHPTVSVTVLEYATQGVTILGEVRNPGSYPLLGEHTILDGIAAAGGLTQYASHNATLTRKGVSFPVSLGSGNSAGANESSEFLYPGDRVLVGRAGTVYVLGDVGKPGGYMLDSYDSLSVLQGLALAQGLNRTAKLQATLIRNTAAGPRPEPLELKKILANQLPDPALRDGDIVYVPLNGAKDWAGRGLNSILQMAVGVVIYGRN
jgi:polysaccharide export outer membrane protein